MDQKSWRVSKCFAVFEKIIFIFKKQESGSLMAFIKACIRLGMKYSKNFRGLYDPLTYGDEGSFQRLDFGWSRFDVLSLSP